MNVPLAILLLLLALTTPAAWAQSESFADANLKRLKGERQRLAVAAAAPIERQYRTALEQLLRVTMQRGDLDGAILIRNAITAASSPATTPAVAATSAPAATPKGFIVPSNPPGRGNPVGVERFANRKWKRSRLQVEFDADGTYRCPYVGDLIPVGTWVATSPTEVLVTAPNHVQMVYRWNADGSIIRGTRQVLFPFVPGDEKTPPAATSTAPETARPFGKPGAGIPSPP